VLAAGTTGPDDMSAFDAALAAGKMARFDMVIPNDCENGHDQCGTHNSVRQFDERSHDITRRHPTVSAGFQRSGFMRHTWNSTGSTSRSRTGSPRAWASPRP
jgi:hypothetical protein